MEELLQVCRDLAARKVDILTIGQYLAPSRNHLPVKRMYPPEEFAFLKQEADKMGFQHVESGPLVRSSYHAHEQAESTKIARHLNLVLRARKRPAIARGPFSRCVSAPR